MVVWYYDVDGRAVDDMDLARTEEADIDPPQVLRYCGGQGVYKGTLVLPDRGSGGRQRGLGGHKNFADRDLEKNGRGFPCLYGL